MTDETFAAREAVEFFEDPVIHPALYLITDDSWNTEDDLKWGPEVTHTSSGGRIPATSWMSLEESVNHFSKQKKDSKKYLCSCVHPIIAVLLKNVLFDSKDPVLWECSGKIKFITLAKVAYCDELTTLRRVNLPIINNFTRMKFGFGCVCKIIKDKVFENWSIDWLTGRNRGKEKADEISKYLADETRRLNKQEEVDYARIDKFNAANWMTLAATAYWNYDKDCDRYVHYWTGLAAVESARIAKEEKVDFDIVSIAEATMIAK